MYEIDNLLAGFVGGFASSSLVIMTYYQHIISKTKQYKTAKIGVKERMKDRLLIMGLEQEIADLKKEIFKINKELYKNQI